MKKYICFLIALVITCTTSYAQYPNQHKQSSPTTQENFGDTIGGGIKARSYAFAFSFDDTASANLTFIKNIPDVLISVKDSVFKRTVDIQRWVNLSTASSSVPPACQGLVFGGIVTLNTGLILDVTNAQYCINGTTYNSVSGTVTLAAADPVLNRKDRIVVNTAGVAVVITGTSAVNPIEPSYDPQTQVSLSIVDIPANATTPSGVTRVVIYNENIAAPTEWTPTTNLSTGSVSFSNTNFPYIGTISADIASGTTGTIQFTKSDTVILSSYDVFQMFLRPKAAIPDASKVEVAFTLGGSVVSNYINCDVTRGYVKSSFGSYQNISISRASFMPLANDSIDGVSIRISGTNSGFYLDYVQLQSGIIPPLPAFDGRYVKIFIDDSIYAKKTFLNDTTWFKHVLINDAITTFPSPVAGWETQAIDTNSVNQLVVDFLAGVRASTGGSVPNFSWVLRSKWSGANQKDVITANGSTGGVTFYNGIQMIGAAGSGTSPTIFAGDTIEYKSSFAHAFRNFRGRVDSADFIQIDGGAGAYATKDAKILRVRGDGNATIASLNNQGTLGLGTNSPSDFAQLDMTSVGRGFLPPRMTTAQRDSMAHTVTDVTLTDGGSNYTLAFPTFSTGSSPVGGINAVVQPTTLSGGVVQGLIIGQAGTGYALGTFPLTVNNTGTGGSGAAGTYTVTAGTIPFGMTIVNIDSVYCPMEIWNGSRWINACDSSAGTFPTGITSITADAPLTGGTITTFGNIGLGTVGETKGGTNQTTYTTGDILYASGANTLSKLPIGTSSQTLHVVGGIPAWRDTAALTSAPNFANTDLVADADRYHDFNGNSLTIETFFGLDDTYMLLAPDNFKASAQASGVRGDLYVNNLGSFLANLSATTNGSYVKTQLDTVTLSNLRTNGRTFTQMVGKDSSVFKFQSNNNTDSNFVLHFPKNYGFKDTIATLRDVRNSGGGGGSGTVTNVSGTSNRITVSSPTTTPVIDISSSYVGQSSITTLGTVTTGTITTGAVLGDVTMNVTGTDATGDLYTRGGSGVLIRIPTGTAKQSVHPDGSGGYVWRDTAVVASPDTLHIDTTQLTITNDTLSLPYKTYAAIITLPGDGTSDPVVTVLQNNVGNIVWTITGTGTYNATLTGAFTEHTVINGVSIKNTGDRGVVSPIAADGNPITGFVKYTHNPNFIQIITYDNITGLASDLDVNDLFLEIRIYP